MKAEYINHYLTDTDVANFARQSFAKLAEQFTKQQNDNLIRFLARGMKSGDWDSLIEQIIQCKDRTTAHELADYLRSIPEHWVPFGHPHISLRMKAPVPIARQAFKHKIGFVESEESRRYISSRPELYLPEHFRAAAENVKQGSAGVHPHSDGLRMTYLRHCEKSIDLYEHWIASEVNWVWTGSLYAFANFYNQRSDSHAQKEIQDLALQVDKIIAPLFPVSWEALTRGIY